jgi:DNA-binding transcriptional ArsR family regulator
MGVRESRIEIVKLARAAFSPIRLGILKLLNLSQMSFSEIAEHLGLTDRYRKATLSYHLKRLINNGLVEYLPRTRSYALTPLGRAAVEIAYQLERRVAKGQVVIRTIDLSAETIDRNRLSEIIVGELRLPARLARKISLTVESNVESLSQDILPQWLVEDMILVELALSGLSINRTSTLAHAGPTMERLQKIFSQTSEKGGWWSFARQVYSTVMTTFVVDKMLPPSFRRHYYEGVVDIYHPAWTPTHVFSLSLNDADEGAVKKALNLVFNDVVVSGAIGNEVRTSIPSQHGPTIYQVVELSANSLSGSSTPFNILRRVKVPSHLLELYDHIFMGYPTLGNHPCLVTGSQKGRPSFTRYVIKPEPTDSPIGTYYFVGVNMFRLITVCGQDWGIFEEEVGRLLSDFTKYAHRSITLLKKWWGEVTDCKLYFLLAPVGAVESIHSISGERVEDETFFKLLCDPLARLKKILDSLSGLAGKILITSSWPAPISDRMLSMDSLISAHSPRFEKPEAGGPSSYSKYLVPPTLLLHKDMVMELSSLITGGILVDALSLDRVSRSVPREYLSDLLQSAPVLLVA